MRPCDVGICDPKRCKETKECNIEISRGMKTFKQSKKGRKV